MTNIKILKVNLDQVKQLQEISKLTFVESFAEYNSKENMSNYLAKNFSLEKLSLEISNPFSLFYFAKLDAEIVAYLKLNFSEAQTELKDKNALEIERIYVLKNHQRKNIGQKLLDFSEKLRIKNQFSYICLGVWEMNEKALNFYKKNDFVEFDKHVFTLGKDKQTDILMRK
jgi:diamine N-acetyltransferase